MLTAKSAIERYYGRHKGSGKSKANEISDGQVANLILLDIRGKLKKGDVMGGGGFQLNVTMTLFRKRYI